MKTLSKQFGSILVDALIALVVLGVGIMAIAKLQGGFFTGSAEAESRNVALQLAQQRIDDLRAYNIVMPTSTTWPVTIKPYSQIRDNMGGSIAWNATTVGNTAYNVSWNVTNYKVTALGTLTVFGDADTGNSSYKAVSVTVNWTTPKGEAQSTTLKTRIAKLDAYGEKLLGGTSVRPDGPRVIYNPGEAPDVISIDTGGESIETTLPEPALKTISGEDYYYSQFETVTYADGIALREEEFLNINCSCQFATGSASNSYAMAYPIGRIIWHPNPNGSEQDKADLASYVNSFFHPPEDKHLFISQSDSSRADFVGNQIKKVTGQSAVAASKQHPFCNICCRDHHDGNEDFLDDQNDEDVTGLSDDQVTGAYACKPDTDFAAAGDEEGDRARCADPWRPTSDYHSDTGDHKHYTTTGLLVRPGVTNAGGASNNIYLESCRLKRVNGNFFVFQDWHLHGSTYATAARAAFTPGAVNNVLTAYRVYIGNYVKKVTERGVNMPNTYYSNPATGYNWPGSLSVTPPATTRFIARGIYMDYLDSYTLSKLNDLRINHLNTFFENVAFNEINVTRLTDWQSACVNGQPSNVGGIASEIVIGSPRTGGFVLKDHDNNPATDPIPVASSCVTDYDIALAGGVVNNIKRGEVLYRNTAPFAVSAAMHLSNTGIVGNSVNQYIIEHTASLYPTYQDRSYDPTRVLYSRNISGSTSPSSSCNVTISGTITKGGTPGAKNAKSVSVSSTPTGTCSVSGGNSSATYSCAVVATDGSSVTISSNSTTPVSGSVTVDCDGSLSLTGPSFVTI